ncbi:MAG: hypothetical protein J7623_31595 [Chitinophaga sp.]|uniref:hypothetical protein n=1 Tax=Chitinophaga sp. TaxID=1869181 RepID=UPI001B00CC0A|nr:hypothetical protein [Chitinophaga sp.]MBO9733228.1 hypothetical protein [Chitinophaga sp.]
MHLNKQLFCLALAVLLASCNLKNTHSKYDNEENTSTGTGKTAPKKNNPPKLAGAVAPIIGERISGNAVIYNNPNGDPIVSLLDYIPLRCAPVKKDWYPVSLDFDITKEEFTKPLFRKGQKIKVNGVAAGVLQRDMKLPVSTNGEKMWATINGYTEKKSIRNGSIIESALTSYLKQHAGRSTDDLQPFIHSFKLEEETTLKPYVLYFNYESGIDDPSPLYRLALIFQGKQLIGVLHARPLQLDGSTTRRLQRGFTVSYLNGIDKTLKEDFAGKFNKFILSVD